MKPAQVEALRGICEHDGKIAFTQERSEAGLVQECWRADAYEYPPARSQEERRCARQIVQRTRALQRANADSAEANVPFQC